MFRNHASAITDLTHIKFQIVVSPVGVWIPEHQPAYSPPGFAGGGVFNGNANWKIIMVPFLRRHGVFYSPDAGSRTLLIM